MKSIYTIFLFICFISTALYAQDPLDCKYNINEAIFYLKGNKYIKQDSLKALKYLKPCVKVKNPTAQLLMARLYLNGNDEKKFKKGFKLTKKAAKQDLALANYDLGVLYKYGKGRKQNLNKANKWFKKGYKLGDSKAAYSLGYMFFKGFGNETQDYRKAVKWFKKSDYPMAKHWLAVCYYFGYGVQQDKSKAMQLLKENPIKNSDRLLNNLNKQFKENDLSKEETFVLNQFYEQEKNGTDNDIDINNLSGNWVGNFIQFDWSNSMIMQKLPTSITFKKDSISGNALYEFLINDNSTSGELLNYTSLKLDGLNLKIKHPYSSNITDVLNYELIPSELQFINHNGNEFIVFSTESYIDGWKEPGAPMLFILRKETDTTIELSNEALTALEAQENSFIKIYPNPFKNDLIFTYDLDKSVNVNIYISSIDGAKTYNIASTSQQKAGEHIYRFDGRNLKKGIYVINITYGNERKTKMIIKN